MVLHIESFRARREVARLEALHRVAEFAVGLPRFIAGIPSGNFDRRRFLFPTGGRNYRMAG
jgi:hypothetical protein